MQLLRLSLAAIGPFAGEHVLDLAELGASGLFLLEGPTGSGKSTLIDAIVFALYGKVASAGASEERLRSDHATPDQESYVELVFSTGAGLYRVRRTPAYRRPKQRGTGTTLQQASVKLWRLSSPDAPGDLLSARLDEAGAELLRIVGLDRTQFVQTVVLPQGEFAAFLRADPEARRGLLQKVFGTEVYERLQVRLERLRAEAAREVAAADQEVGRVAARFAGAADVALVGWVEAGVGEGEAAGGGAAAEAGSLVWADEVAGALRLWAAEAGARAQGAREALDAARAEADRRTTLAGLVRERDRLLADRAGLDAASDEHATATERWRAASAAEQVWRWVERASTAGRDAAEAGVRLAVAREAAGEDLRAVVGEGDAEVALKALLAEVERCAELRLGLAHALRLEAGLAERREELVAGAAARGSARAALEVEAAALAGLPARRAALVAEREPLAATAAGVEAARAALATAQARVAAGREAAGLARDVAAAEAAVRELAVRAAEAVDAAARAHRARIAGIAGELAAGLVPGEACPVCGSAEHPAPAPAGHDEAPDPEAAEAARAAAQDALTSANTALAVLRERLAARLAEAGEDPEGAVEAAAAVLVAAHDAAERLAALDAEVAALDTRLAEGRRELDAATARLDADERVAAAQAAALDLDEAEVLAAADGLPSVRHRDEDLRRRAEQARAWSTALEAFVLAAEAERAAERERDAALAEAGLALDAVLLARLPRAELDALRAAIDAHVAARARVDDALGRLPADLPADEASLDLPGARAALDAADRAAAGAGSAAAVLARRADAAADALEVLRAATADLDAARAAAAPVTRMANLAAASGGEGDLTLATYVLAQRFEDLVAAANARLSGISDGRYELVRSTEREDVRSRRLGLALTVQDHRTGRSRDPRTLSGGETFYVSLCLALGLADVVTAEAGGLELGTLLVDEGFGSLDAETLEVVLAELCRLRDGGRTVGVVSHVDTLKQAIAERVEVRRLPSGASTLTVRA